MEELNKKLIELAKMKEEFQELKKKMAVECSVGKQKVDEAVNREFNENIKDDMDACFKNFPTLKGIRLNSNADLHKRKQYIKEIITLIKNELHKNRDAVVNNQEIKWH